MGDRNESETRKLPTAAELAADFAGHLEREGFQTLAISANHAIRAGLLPGLHKNPFDRVPRRFNRCCASEMKPLAAWDMGAETSRPRTTACFEIY
jgi:PIN domain nuclease of toxin-antitoxin system